MQASVSDLRKDIHAWRQATGTPWPPFEPLRIPEEARSPFLRFNARFAAWRLEFLTQTQTEKDLQPEMRVLENRLKTPHSPAIPELQFAMMKGYLHNDDLERFTEHLRAVLLDQEMAFQPTYIMDFTTLAAVCDHREQLNRYLTRVQVTIENLFQERKLNGSTAIPHLAILAVAFHANNNTSAAKTILSRIGTMVPEPSRMTLWMIDAMDRCGQQTEATVWRKTLTQNGLMPASRSQPTEPTHEKGTP